MRKQILSLLLVLGSVTAPLQPATGFAGEVLPNTANVARIRQALRGEESKRENQRQALEALPALRSNGIQAALIGAAVGGAGFLAGRSPAIGRGPLGAIVRLATSGGGALAASGAVLAGGASLVPSVIALDEGESHQKRAQLEAELLQETGVEISTNERKILPASFDGAGGTQPASVSATQAR